MAGWGGVWKTQSAPAGASGFRRATFRGVSLETYPPSVDLWALAFARPSHRPSRRKRRGGRCPFSEPITGCPDFDPTSPFHADPVTRVIDPGAGEPLPRSQLGWPRRPQPPPQLRCPGHPRPGCLAAAARLLERPQQVSVVDGSPPTRSDPAPSQLPAPDADPSLLRFPEARLEVAGKYVSVFRTRCASLAPAPGRSPIRVPRLACALRNVDQLRPQKTPGQGVFSKSQGYPRKFLVLPRISPVVHPIPTVHAQGNAQPPRPLRVTRLRQRPSVRLNGLDGVAPRDHHHSVEHVVSHVFVKPPIGAAFFVLGRDSHAIRRGLRHHTA